MADPDVITDPERVRAAVVAHTLGRLVAGRDGLRVLAVGDGGRDVLPLARAGHDVTVLDPSPDRRDAAVAAAAAAGAAERLTVVAGGVEDLRGSGLEEFDLVVCHDVLQDVPDLRRGVGAVVAAAASGGLVSLVCPDPAAAVLADLVRGGDPAAALARLDAAGAGVPVEAAERALVAAGCELLHRFGVGCVTDLLPAAGGPPDALEALEALEVALCDREPYRRVARRWQLVARPF